MKFKNPLSNIIPLPNLKVKGKMFWENLDKLGPVGYNKTEPENGLTSDKKTPRRLKGTWAGVKESGAIPLYEDENQGMQEPDVEEQDLIEGVDEDGNKVLLQVMEYFFYNGEEYVVLADAPECDDESCAGCDHGCEHDHDHDEELGLYIMKVVTSTDENGDEMEEFVPVDEDLMDKLIEVVQTNFSDEEDEDEADDE